MPHNIEMPPNHNFFVESYLSINNSMKTLYLLNGDIQNLCTVLEKHQFQ